MSPDNSILITVDEDPDVIVLGTSHFPGPQGPVGPMGPPGESAGNTTIVDLTSSQLLDLHNNPIEAVPAQGPGTIVLLRSIICNYTHNTEPYYGSGPRFMYGLDNNESIGEIPGLMSRTGDWINSDTEINVEGSPEDLENKSIFIGYTPQGLEEENGLHNIGVIESHEVGVGGSGYEVGDPGYVSFDGGGSSGKYEVLSVDGSGAILTYSLEPDNPGQIMTDKVGPVTTTPQTGAGDGFEIEILSVIIGDGDIRLYIEWQLFFLGS